MVVVVACRIILSAPVPVPFLRTLDFGFGTWIWDLVLGQGFRTWIWDLDLGLGFGTGLGLDNSKKYSLFKYYRLLYEAIK